MSRQAWAADALRGLLVYGSGDGLAAWLRGDFSFSRLSGMALVGCGVYGLEIPAYFRWIDRVVPARLGGLKATLQRTALALLYFNPLWIARHLLFIECFAGRWQAVDERLLWIGGLSFAANIPVSFAANYLIQNQVPTSWRFVASAVFSSAMAMYYALSEAWFG